MKRQKKARALVIDIRDQRLPDGRLALSSRTRDTLEYTLRLAAVRTLLEDGERGLEILRRLQAGQLRIERVAEAVHAKRVAELLAEAEAEDVPQGVRQRLGATVDRFLLLVEAKLSEGTLIQYRGFCRDMERVFGVERDDEGQIVRDVPIDAVTTEAAEGWLHGPKKQRKKGAADKPWSANRQNVAHAVAHQVWGLAIEADEETAEREGTPRTLTRNVFGKGKARVRPPKVRKTRVVFLSRKKAGRLLWAVRGRPSAALMAAGIYAGLRAGEAVNLRLVTDVRFAKMEIAIQPREGEYPWRTKTDNSIREVPMHPNLARWFRAHIRQGFAGEVYLTRPANEDKPIAPKTRERWTVEAFTKAGIAYGRDRGQGATFHTLRHTFASWLAQKDVQLMKIAALMGDTVNEVEATYAHLLPRDLRGAVERLNKKKR